MVSDEKFMVGDSEDCTRRKIYGPTLGSLHQLNRTQYDCYLVRLRQTEHCQRVLGEVHLMPRQSLHSTSELCYQPGGNDIAIE